MPRQEHVLSVFVASPGDVQAERQCLEEVIAEINQVWSRSLGLRFDLIKWETHSHPDFGVDAQDVINRQLPNDCDVFIGIMWHRFGAPTDRAQSGTEEEFLRAKARWDLEPSSVTLMIYFKNAAVPRNQIDGRQITKVNDFKQSLPSDGGLYWEFETTDQFAALVRAHLTRVAQSWQSRLGPRHATPASDVVAKATESSSFVEPADEDGIFDLYDIAEENMRAAADILIGIHDVSKEIDKRMGEHVDQMQILKNSQASRAAVKRVINRFARDLDIFSDKQLNDVPRFGDRMKQVLEALAQIIVIWPEMSTDINQRSEIGGAIGKLRELRQLLRDQQDLFVSYRRTVSAIPRLTRELNSAKRKTLAAIETTVEVYEGHQRIIAQMEDAGQAVFDRFAVNSIFASGAVASVAAAEILAN
jgi:Domain of unknown function (DUF4062)